MVPVSQRQTCKACGRPDKFDYTIPDELWARIVPLTLQSRVVCLHCFDEFARERGVLYAASLTALYFAGDRAAFCFRPEWAAD
ncbi:hypothetical protein DDZ18_09885 [Marinicauda salina]|uniref:Uncharacterized protein n=1 Tax=Marinicauda salina TaxID=2135793 RepID=A0A2U2BSK7_9PROT|nr:hypothetical protein DDZ18_09885 [Marinicauda salina]